MDMASCSPTVFLRICYGGRAKEKRRSIDAPELPGGRTDGTCGLLVSPR